MLYCPSFFVPSLVRQKDVKRTDLLTYYWRLPTLQPETNLLQNTTAQASASVTGALRGCEVVVFTYVIAT